MPSPVESLARIYKALGRRVSPGRRRMAQFAAGLDRAQSAPFALSLYAESLRRYREAGIAFPRFSEFDARQCAVYLRHDIDLEQCPSVLPAMLQVEADLGMHSATFFQTNDQVPYDLRSLRTLVEDMVREGFDVGLHTLCYIAPDPLHELIEEKKRFEDALGMSPMGLNAHGLGQHKIRERNNFYKFMTKQKIAELGFSYSDLSNYIREYNHVAEDCHIDGVSDATTRFLKSDYLTPPPLFPRMHYLVLTHPGYWIAPG